MRISTFAAIFAATFACVAAELPKGVKAPADFDVTLFAAPPNVGYPTCLAAAPSGELYVGIDENGSIDSKPKRGRVVRCIDRDGDGVADEFKTFAEMDSPRGVWFHNNVLYVQHPPFVEAYIDDNGDGVSDRSEILVRGLGFDLKFRGADHTVNGMQMGIDGFLYIACGDYGATNAVGKDGSRIQLHGGGVVRVRPDGTGLEIVSHGQRNIYDVAISPELDLFTRDNTNDGGGWDVRLSHVVMFGEFGYPTLFRNSPPEIIQPLADYGGGSPCGSLFMDEPGYPKDYGTALYTCEWGRSKIFRHPLARNGASYSNKVAQVDFMDVPRATDMDVDGSGRIYVASWAGGGFTYSEPNVGYVLGVVPKGFKATAFPDLQKVPDAKLVDLLKSPSAVCRLHTQREILRRGIKPNVAQALQQLASSKDSLPSRIAAVFTLEQLLGSESYKFLSKLSQQDAEIREAALRALANNKVNATSAPTQPLVAALSDTNARVRLQAVTGLGRLGKTVTATAMLPLVADPDPIVSHVTINALAKMQLAEPCLKAMDSPGSANLVPGALRVLQQIHTLTVVDGLITRLNATTDVTTRQAILRGLARLYNREADWDGRWWGTRPDTTGPYFKPVKWEGTDKIADVLRKELATATGDTTRWLALELQKNRVDLPELTAVVLKLAGSDPTFNTVAVELFADRPTIPDEAIPLLAAVANNTEAATTTRGKAMKALLRASAKPAAFDALLASLSAVTEQKQDNFNDVWENFVRDSRNAQRLPIFVKLATSGTAGERVISYGVLVSAATQRLSGKEARAEASRAIDSAWSQTDRVIPLLHAIARLKADTYALQVNSLLTDSRKEVAAAAKRAAGQFRTDKKSNGGGALIETLKFDQVVAEAQKEKGDTRSGRELFTRQGCVACHTVSSEEAPKGPFLGGIATRYSRAELCESILKPSAKIAQGFETQWFKTKDEEELEGFVTREGGDDLDVRNIAGITTTLAKKDIAGREKREKSMMPEGLADKMTPGDLASLLAYLESLKSK